MKRQSGTHDVAVRLWFWAALLALWALVVAGLVPGVIATTRDPTVSQPEAWAVVSIGAASSLIWLGGIRHLLMWLVSRLPRPDALPGPLPEDARVLLVYCTADDFNAVALTASMNQGYPVSTVILDDSSSPESRQAVDASAALLGVRVIRRAASTGFKAGNLNHGLPLVIGDADYVVILDSDEVIPADFVERALADFSLDDAIGIVQGRHRALGTGTRFSSTFAGLVESHVAVVQGARSRVGLSVFMGRGAMISAECIRRAGPFPEIVTEDVGMSIQTRLAGLEIYFDPAIVSEEDFPVDYSAFRTQHAKTIQGTTEFIARSSARIARSDMRLSEKADVLLEQFLAPAMGMSGLVVLTSGIVLAAIGAEVAQPVWSVVLTVVLGLAALLPGTVDVAREHGLLRGVRFLGGAALLYSSTFLITLNATLKVLLGGRATFVVTPKTPASGSWWSAVAAIRIELAVAGVATVLALGLTGSITPALPILGPVAGALVFSVASVLASPAMRARDALRVHPERAS